ncbi:MAG: alpha-amylase family glycosyl hydrolase [Candidatus Izemoplasmatales bacterium]|jgi:alpha-amylase|nr:alpha-amylase family glycosyl hydrolase [Candidatus Izemoplasmatales bacterium]
MTKKILFIAMTILLSLAFISCNTKTTEIELLAQEPTVESGYLVDNVQDGTILHAWNWSLVNIEENLEDIAIAGFSTIQISPMQPQKDFFGIATYGSSWWKLYQPLGFSIATADHSIGTRADLESLTAAAEEFGIKIIVDVVLNHLSSDGNNTLDPNVASYEPEIYNQNLIRTNNGLASDSSVFSVTRGSLGELVDLQTETQTVQDRVLSLLKEYVDAGVAGFRFDAAKHIETPNDGDLSSNFWPYILNGVNAYANGLGKDNLYFYGEILNTAGANRSYTDYTNYMSVTANHMSDVIRQAVISKNLSALIADNYIDGVDAAKTVLWAESHDTFADGSTKSTPDSYLTKAYVINASRSNATSLFFARPNDNSFMGEIGSYLWKSLEVSEINRFHNYFAGTSEYLSGQDNFFLNERFDDELFGVVIVDLAGTKKVNNIPVYNIPDGNYYDQISDSNFVVKDGKISGNVGDSGIAIVYNNPYQAKPSFYLSDDGSRGSFTDTKKVTIYSFNTTEAYYSVNGGSKVSFSGTVDVTLSHPDDNATVTLDLELWYGDYLIERQFTYIKSNIVVTEIVVNNIDISAYPNSKIAAWVWEEGEDGRWVEGTLSGSTYNFNIGENDDYFLLVLFPNTQTSFNWDDKLAQTGDTEIMGDGTYDGSSFVWA